MSRKLEKPKIGRVHARNGHVNHAKAGFGLEPRREISPPRRTNTPRSSLDGVLNLFEVAGGMKETDAGSAASSLGSEFLSATRSSSFYLTDVLARRATCLTFM